MNREIPLAPPAAEPCPWLVYYHGRGYKNQTFCSNISGPQPVQTYCKTIPALHDNKVLSCSYGWLVLYDDRQKVLSLCNCSTFSTITLPRLDLLSSEKNKFNIDSCILSSSPNSPDCEVLLFPEKVHSIMCCRLHDKEWSEVKYGEQLRCMERWPRNLDINETPYFCQPVICEGKIFAKISVNTIRFRKLFLIEIVKDEPMRVVLSRIDSQPLLNHQYSRHSEVFIVESCSELFSLFFWRGGIMRRDILAVEVFRLNFSTMDWKRVDNIEDRSFFICPNYSISCRSSGPGSIYFTRNEDYSLYCYNMECESLSASLPVPHLTKPLLPPIWMMPEQLVRQQDFCKEENIETGSLDSEDIIQEDMGEQGLSTDEEKQLSGLPFDILREVTKHLVPLDYMNFRGVCRVFRQLAPPMNWRTELSRSKTSLSFPLLMSAEKEKGLYKFIDPRINSNDSYLMRIAKYQKIYTIQYSNHGWLLLTRGRSAHLYNPFTKDIRYSTWIDMPESSSFFSLQASAGYSVALISISFYLRNPILVSILYPGANQWSQYEFGSRYDFEPTHNNPVLFKDAYYYLGQSGILGRFKLDDNSCTWEVLDEPTIYCFSFHHSFLVECGGDLLAIFVACMGKLVVVYKLNPSEKAWETVTSLNNYSLYLSRTSSFSAVAGPGSENRIYFPRLVGCGIVFYSMETRKWHVPGSRDSYNDFYGTKLLLSSCWIQPSWC